MQTSNDRITQLCNKMTELSFSYPEFTFQEVIEQNKLDSPLDTDKSGYHFICCPFHDDDDPSLSISEERRTWYCYGCLKRGDFLDFLVQIDIKNGKYTNREKKADELLKTNTLLQTALPFKSVHVKKSQFRTIEPVTRSRIFNDSENVITLQYVLQEIKLLSLQDRLRYISLLQNGVTPEYVHKALRGK